MWLWKTGRGGVEKSTTPSRMVSYHNLSVSFSSQAGEGPQIEAEKCSREHGLLDEGRSESFPRLILNPSPAPVCALAFTFKWNQMSEHWQMKYSSTTGNKKAPPPPCFLERWSHQEMASFRQRYRVIYGQQRLSFTPSHGMKKQRDKSGHGLLTYTWPYQCAASEWCLSISVSQPVWLVISALKMVQRAPFNDPPFVWASMFGPLLPGERFHKKLSTRLASLLLLLRKTWWRVSLIKAMRDNPSPNSSPWLFISFYLPSVCRVRAVAQSPSTGFLGFDLITFTSDTSSVMRSCLFKFVCTVLCWSSSF